MFFMFFTAVVSQVLMSWSNDMAPWNMPSMSVTLVITHLLLLVGMGWLKATAPLNMFEVLVKSFVSQVFRGWLKAFAPLNIRTMSVTLFVFHLLPSVGMAWLNFAAPLNMFFMVVTSAVFQSLMDASPALLKAAASSNVANIVVTRAVSQVPTFWLKALAPSNMPAMSVTLDVFHQRLEHGRSDHHEKHVQWRGEVQPGHPNRRQQVEDEQGDGHGTDVQGREGFQPAPEDLGDKGGDRHA